MREVGEQFVCDRCGEELFIPEEGNASKSYPNGWGYHIDGSDTPYKDYNLCPDCYSTYVVMIADFMGRGK